MQIRRRKNRLSLFRTVYDKARKRGRTVHIGSVPTDGTPTPDALRQLLTQKEQDQLWKELDAMRREREKLERRRTALNLPKLLAQSTHWYLYESSKSAELSQLAKSSRDAFSELLAAMVKAGVGRRRSSKPRQK